MPLAITPREQRTIIRALRILDNTLQSSGALLSNPNATADYLRLHFNGLEREEFRAFWLDAGNRLIAVETLSTGTLTQTTVHPREVVRAAMRANAAAVIVAHNHPSERPEPSAVDIALTYTLKQALGLVDVRLLDHFIVTTQRVLSLAEAGHV